MSQRSEKLRRQVEQTRADVDDLRDRVDAVLTSSASITSRYRRRAIAAERRVLRLKLIASLLAMASVAMLALVIRAGADALPEDKPPAQAETETAIVAPEPVEEPENELIEAALRTTGAQRTGCSMCGFGIHMEPRPNRFDLCRQRRPQEWEMLMYHLYTDADGNDHGWGEVLDYIDVEWRDAEEQERIDGV